MTTDRLRLPLAMHLFGGSELVVGWACGLDIPENAKKGCKVYMTMGHPP